MRGLSVLAIRVDVHFALSPTSWDPRHLLARLPDTVVGNKVLRAAERNKDVSIT